MTARSHCYADVETCGALMNAVFDILISSRPPVVCVFVSVHSGHGWAIAGWQNTGMLLMQLVETLLPREVFKDS